jgi:hypothetical protein
MAAGRPKERVAAFVMALDGGPVFGGLGDLYPYEVEVEPEIEIIEVDMPPPESFQSPEERTAVMPAAKLVERCRTAAAPPPLPAEERLKAFRQGVKRALREADLEAMIPWIFANAEAYPLPAPKRQP